MDPAAGKVIRFPKNGMDWAFTPLTALFGMCRLYGTGLSAYAAKHPSSYMSA